MNNLIKIYISKIKKEDINTFLKENSINLSDNELNYLYSIKNKYELIINEDQVLLDEISNNISKDNYNKLLNLFYKYKNIYLK